MFSSLSALRALLVAFFLSQSVLSLPPTVPLKRSIQDYADQLIYRNAATSALYCAVGIDGQTYAAQLDNHWGGLMVNSGSAQGALTPVPIGSWTLYASDNNGTVGFLGEEIGLEYYTISRWPSQWPQLGSSAGVGDARIGIDISNSNSPISKYLASQWPSPSYNWYYDILLIFELAAGTDQTTEIEIAGVFSAGTTLDWTSLLGISSSQVSQYGLPDLSGINQQPSIWLQPSGTFYIGNCIWANNQPHTIASQVPQTASGIIVAVIDVSTSWSYAPYEIVAGLYSGIPGAQYNSQATYGYYQIPCDAVLAFLIIIDGQNYSFTEASLITSNPWGDQCIGTIFTLGQAVSAAPSWDISIGIYLLSSFYYRTGIDPNTNQIYSKLLPLPSPNPGYSNSLWNWSNTTIQYSSSGSSSSSSNSGSGYSGSGYTSGSGSGYSGSGSNSGWGNNGGSGYQGSRSTTTTFTTVTHTVIGTTTVAWPPSGATGYSGSGFSGSGSGSGSGSSGSGLDAENLAVAGNAAQNETDENGNDLNLPHGSLADKLKHCSPAIIVLFVILAVGLVIGLITFFVLRRRNQKKPGGSAYSSVHFRDVHEPVNVPLYGAEEGESRYSDPYKDHQ
ncbi:hypothetical protein BD414DRAFT_513600 [Trametes punicea]|nr:hypothetical protein BD414DRAFT_513600 [Trametes punicea]